MIFSQLPEFAQIKACELLSSKYFHCTNEADRTNLANEARQAFVNLFTEGKPAAVAVSETNTTTTCRKAYSNSGQHLCDVIYDNQMGTITYIDEVHQDVTNAFCAMPNEHRPPKIKAILIPHEETKIIRGKLSDDQLIDWLQKLISEIEISRQVPEGIQRNERMLNEKRELLSRNKDYLNNSII
ncbi:hypothetical protein [Serratia fonticola]